ncbi:carbon monoxide dehydrogenase subunit G [Anaerolineales bacterium HSG6]|nr:carbon monoxide dehydrogenase subunit G [Anaerolineales bacterium HSG6]
MKLEGTYTFQAPQQAVWDALMDTDVLQRVIPGCESLTEIGENQYESIMKIKVGPVQGKFKGSVTLSDIEAPNSYQMQVKGKGAPGHMTGDGTVRLTANDDDTETTMHYGGEAKIGGKIAGVGQRLMTSVAESLTQKGLEELDKQIQARLAPPAPVTSDDDSMPTPPPPVSPPPPAPSQTEFASGVAKNMLDDLIPPETRPQLALTAAGTVGMVLLVWWLSKRTGSPSISDLSEQLSELEETQLRPFVKDLTKQLADLDTQQIRPFVQELGEQLAELNQSQIQPFILELGDQMSMLNEQQVRPLVQELGRQLADIRKQENALDYARSMLSEITPQQKQTAAPVGLLAGFTLMVAVVWWFLNRQAST